MTEISYPTNAGSIRTPTIQQRRDAYDRLNLAAALLILDNAASEVLARTWAEAVVARLTPKKSGAK